MTGRLIEEDLFTKYSIVDSHLPEGIKIHDFLASRAKALAGKYIDFDKTPVTFVLSDSDEPNAFYMPAPDPNSENRPRRDEYTTTRFVKNPLDTAIICVTRGLIEMIDNLDQLDFVIGHELTHMIMRLHGIKRNSKGEEGGADLHSVDLMYDAGSDPKQALVISKKISVYSQEQRKIEKQRYRSREEKEEGIDWAIILDVHMTDENRKAGIEVALTKLSHLIDDRQPSSIDKSIFNSRYDDPVDTFLRSNNYKEKNPLDKLKNLVDAIGYLSMPVAAEEFFQATLDALPEETDDVDWRAAHERKELQKRIDAGYTNYFSGPVLDKKYQQKIANLAEKIVEQIQEDEKDKTNTTKPADINYGDLNTYLLDSAYQHISAKGYPTVGDVNYLSASGILYSYFSCLFESHLPNDGKRDIRTAQIETDIESAKNNIRSAVSAETFTQAAENLSKVTNILRDIKSITYGSNGRGEKLDNLSALSSHRFDDFRDRNPIYNELEEGKIIPWNNLVEISQSDENSKESVHQFLAKNNIKDYRVTHGLPYIRTGYSNSYSVMEDGKTLKKEIPEYELDFAIDREVVLQAYSYIKNYFNNEAALIDKKCAEALTIEESDFVEPEEAAGASKKNTAAYKKIYDFVSVFNALPKEREPEQEHYHDPRTAISLIPDSYQQDHPIPGSKEVVSMGQKKIVPTFSQDLLSFKNPIFKTHFEEDFEQKVVAKKAEQQQQMFDTAYGLLDKFVVLWLDAKPRLNILNEKNAELSREIWGSRKRETSEEKMLEYQTVQEEYSLYKEIEDQTRAFIYNFLSSAFSGQRQWYQLQRLKPEQRKMLAEFAVKDEKGAIMQIFHAERYEDFCNYLGILEAQTQSVISGNYELTDMMRIVADHYDYKKAMTKDALKAYVDACHGNKYSQDNQKYAWYLHVFDTMQYLQNTSEVNVWGLATALTELYETEKTHRGDEYSDIASARYRNHRSFIRKSNLVSLVERAIDHQDNYKDLSCDELLQTADALIVMRGQMNKIFEKTSDDDYLNQKRKSKATSKQKSFLGIVDKNIEGILKKIEQQALNKENALEKITTLYRLYNPENDGYSREKDNYQYLEKLIKQEESLKKLSALSEDDAFWPEDTFDHIKAFIFAKNTFLDDKEFEDRLLNDIMEKLESQPAGKKKNEGLLILLDKNLRAAYPETRERLFTIYADSVKEKLGTDDGSKKYQKRLSTYLNALEENEKKDWDIGKKHGRRDGLLSNSMSLADKYLLMRHLSDTIVSQEETSRMVKESCQIKLNSDDMVASYLYGIGVDYLTEEMNRDAEMANKFIGFFNSKGERADCEDISNQIALKIKEKYASFDKSRCDDILQNTTPANCGILYENFWSAPLEARTVIIARMLKSAVKGTEDHVQHPWERVFDRVMDTLIKPDDASTEGKYARDIMHSYIKSRSDYERELIMSAMMVANKNIGNDKGNIGKALKLFLENMGPAEIKMGQAIASHPHTPKTIKAELQKLKGAANMPSRWTLYEWIKAENIPEHFWKDQYLGEILGSASYYTTVGLGEDKVLRILRPEAREKAAKGFKVLRSTVEDLEAKKATSGLNYQELTSAVQEMVVQATRMSDIETDHEAGQQQYEHAKDIYNNVTIASDKQEFHLKVMDWRAKGKNWIIMDKANGKTFNAMPKGTSEQIEYKKNFAKAYIVFEIKNILSGGKFDHDKHGAQLSIDKKTNVVGIYDTGAMALQDPSPENQRLLGNIVYDVIKDTFNGNDAFASFNRAISERMEKLHKDNADTQYLVEVKKGLLALDDFFQVLTQEDMKDILPSINFSTDISKNVQRGITENMSLFEKAQYKAFLAMQPSKRKDGITIHKADLKSEFGVNVQNIAALPEKQNKADWLQNALSNPGDDSQTRDASQFVFNRTAEQVVGPSYYEAANASPALVIARA